MSGAPISQGLLLSSLKHYTGSKLDLISDRSQMKVRLQKQERIKKEFVQINIRGAIYAVIQRCVNKHT